MNDAIIVVVITDIEYKALRSVMVDVEAPIHTSSAFLEKGRIGETAIVLCKIRDMGSKTVGAVGVALPSIFELGTPRYVIELGICFSLKTELRIGDVCICKTTCDYEYQKRKDNDALHRHRSLSSPDPLFSQLSHFALNHSDDYRALTGVYACGDKVVDDKEFKASVVRAVSDALAGDMESFPLALACDQKKVAWAVIKGASDDGVNKVDDAQTVAAQNAVNFFHKFLISLQDHGQALKLEINSTLTGIDYKDISREILGKKEIVSKPYNSVRTGFEAHFHPELDGAWGVIYIYKAHSIPEALRTFLHQFQEAPRWLDVCLVSREYVSPQRVNSYESQLKKAGCHKVHVSSIKQFVFERVVMGRLQLASVGEEKKYVDQKVFRDGAEPISSRQYMAMFLSSREPGSKSPLKPINVILGEGGVGKTTLCGNLAQHFLRFGNKEEFLLLVTKHDILRGYSGATVDSITDLYREYRRGLGGALRTL